MRLTMTIRTVLRVAAALAACLALAALAATVVVPALVPAEKLAAAFEAHLTRIAGAPVKVAGPAKLVMLPRPVFRLETVTVGEADRTPLLTAEAVDGRISVISALLGRVAFEDVTLVRPRANLERPTDGRPNWEPARTALLALLGGRTKLPTDAGGDLANIGTVRVIGGEAVLALVPGKPAERLTDIALTFAWPTPASPANLDSTFLWRHQSVTANLEIANPAAYIAGRKTAADLSLETPSGLFKLAGTVSGVIAPTRFEGQLTAETSSLRRTLRWLGLDIAEGGGFRAMTMQADTIITGPLWTLTSVNLALDGNVAEGSLAVRLDRPKPMLQGTLDAGKLDITPYVADYALVRSGETDWSRHPLDLSDIASFDLDLRISADKVTMPQAALGETAAAIAIRGGRLTIGLAETQAYGGTIKGTLSFAETANGVNIRSQIALAKVDLDRSLKELFGLGRIAGNGDLTLQMETTGRTIADMARSLDGALTLVAVNGTVAGIDVEQLMRRLDKRPLSGLGDIRGGRTAFESLSAHVKIAAGLARTEDFVLAAKDLRIALQGTASVPSREFDLRGSAVLKMAPGAPGKPESVFDLPFLVAGAWESPLVLPDAQALITRSNAAQPLVEATRDRITREAIQSLIEQFKLRQRADDPAAVPGTAYAPVPAAPPMR